MARNRAAVFAALGLLAGAVGLSAIKAVSAFPRGLVVRLGGQQLELGVDVVGVGSVVRTAPSARSSAGCARRPASAGRRIAAPFPEPT
jgi:hypothetical protein